MTKGYDPHQTLWQIFHHSDSTEPLTREERAKIGSVVGYVTEKRLHPDDSPYHRRFADLMLKEGHGDTPKEHLGLVQGLIECLNDYQAYVPWTNPESIPLGVYDHFKGGIYKIRGFSSWESGDRERVVEYDSLLFGTPHSRFAWQWCEVVKWPDAKYRSRWVYRGPDLHTPAPSYKVPSPT